MVGYQQSSFLAVWSDVIYILLNKNRWYRSWIFVIVSLYPWRWRKYENGNNAFLSIKISKVQMTCGSFSCRDCSFGCLSVEAAALLTLRGRTEVHLSQGAWSLRITWVGLENHLGWRNNQGKWKSPSACGAGAGFGICACFWIKGGNGTW